MYVSVILMVYVCIQSTVATNLVATIVISLLVVIFVGVESDTGCRLNGCIECHSSALISFSNQCFGLKRSSVSMPVSAGDLLYSPCQSLFSNKLSNVLLWVHSFYLYISERLGRDFWILNFEDIFVNWISLYFFHLVLSTSILSLLLLYLIMGLKICSFISQDFYCSLPRISNEIWLLALQFLLFLNVLNSC